MSLHLQTIWQGLLGFVFYYPLFMSYLWMLGAAIFFWRYERGLPSYTQPRMLPNTPPVSIIIPCYNEGDNAEETL